jgi:hypothetical protein
VRRDVNGAFAAIAIGPVSGPRRFIRNSRIHAIELSLGPNRG